MFFQIFISKLHHRIHSNVCALTHMGHKSVFSVTRQVCRIFEKNLSRQKSGREGFSDHQKIGEKWGASSMPEEGGFQNMENSSQMDYFSEDSNPGLLSIPFETAPVWQEAKGLVMEVLGWDSLRWLSCSSDFFPALEMPKLANWVRRFLRGEPLSRLAGRKPFWKHTFSLNSWTLDPRPETEGLVALVLSCLPPKQNISFLELGLGSGCVLLSLLWECPESFGVGVDQEERVFPVVADNAKKIGVCHRVRWQKGNWLENLEPYPYDCIVANPPYVSSWEMPLLPSEVALWDPALALDGGQDGLECYRKILSRLPLYISDHSRVFFEIGHQQGKALRELLGSIFPYVYIVQDLSEKDRYSVASFQPIKNLQQTEALCFLQ